MSTKVVMEALSPTMEEGRLVEWKKQEGEAVAVGDVLAEVETDKAVMELVARAGGTPLKHNVEAGATVPVSEPVAVIGEPGEDSGAAGQRDGGADGKRGSGAAGQPTSMPPAPPTRVAAESTPAVTPRPAAAGSSVAVSPQRVARTKASPLARRIAAERGVDLGAGTRSAPG